jgi:hypothetical protein
MSAATFYPVAMSGFPIIELSGAGAYSYAMGNPAGYAHISPRPLLKRTVYVFVL